EVRLVVSHLVPAGAGAALEAAEGSSVETATIADDEKYARSWLSSDRADVVVASSTRAKAAIAGAGAGELRPYFDSTKSFSPAAVRRVSGALEGWATAILGERMRAHDLPETTASPVAIIRRSIATEKEVGSQIASMALPALLLMFIALSSFYPA